ncbi:MAG: hypothetical protein ACRC8E_17605 [Plesiomonas shigelloides]|uniref:hypothetical protein n=1 Tax=Plesiomonas shigelloides TaxID=703 RepID=UPI001E652823|nr:hypothetical protein [Plesiomonas shigelloides]
MDRILFKSLFRRTVPVNTVFSNPGGGTSTVCKTDADRVVYKRGNSRMTLLLDDLYIVYKELEANSKVSSSDLKQLKPSVFDSTKNGHSCHCTFAFSVLNQMGLSSDIGGKGVRGNPFYTTFT